MPIKMLLPFVYLSIGFLVGKTPLEIKRQTSYILVKIIIPLVIIYNIATYRAEVFVLMAAMIAIICCMFFLSGFATNDIIKRLCFCYLNIGWMAVPIAGAVWGDGAVRLLIAMYTGNSVFGNSVGASLLANDSIKRMSVKKTFCSPPVIALIIGILCIPFGDYFRRYCNNSYYVLKWIMSFLGMAVLGMWLSDTKIKKRDIKTTLILAVLRAATMSALGSLLLIVAYQLHFDLITENKKALFMLGVLPPAANIIVLETHYKHTGQSASLIACGTLFSIAFVIIYIAGTSLLF